METAVRLPFYPAAFYDKWNNNWYTFIWGTTYMTCEYWQLVQLIIYLQFLAVGQPHSSAFFLDRTEISGFNQFRTEGEIPRMSPEVSMNNSIITPMATTTSLRNVWTRTTAPTSERAISKISWINFRRDGVGMQGEMETHEIAGTSSWDKDFMAHFQ